MCGIPILDTTTKIKMEIALIHKKIFEIRGQKVMLDIHIAELYEVETRILKRAVRRNIDKFPSEFMFELNEKEIQAMVSKIGIPSKSYFGGAKPFAFTEHGIAMLSSVLRSKKATQINIGIIKVFIALKQYAMSYKELQKKIEELEKKYDKNFEEMYEALKYLMSPPNPPRKQIGYKYKKSK